MTISVIANEVKQSLISVIASDAPVGLERGDLIRTIIDFYMKNNLYFIYIMTNPLNTVLYIGVTNNLKRRVYEHKEKIVEGFTKKYNCTKLVYYEYFETAERAITREKQLKAGSRMKKEKLVINFNPTWKDLYNEIM